MAETDLITRPDEIAARALPSNVEAEAAFLGAALIDNRVIEELNTPLRPEHYFEPVHARIYERILQLLDRRVTGVTTALRSSNCRIRS